MLCTLVIAAIVRKHANEVVDAGGDVDALAKARLDEDQDALLEAQEAVRFPSDCPECELTCNDFCGTWKQCQKMAERCKACNDHCKWPDHFPAPDAAFAQLEGGTEARLEDQDALLEEQEAVRFPYDCPECELTCMGWCGTDDQCQRMAKRCTACNNHCKWPDDFPAPDSDDSFAQLEAGTEVTDAVEVGGHPCKKGQWPPLTLKEGMGGLWMGDDGKTPGGTHDDMLYSAKARKHTIENSVVERLQAALTWAFEGHPDPDPSTDNTCLKNGRYAFCGGTFGWRTKELLEKFQKRSGLKADGVAGPKTWLKLSGLEWDTGFRAMHQVKLACCESKNLDCDEQVLNPF